MHYSFPTLVYGFQTPRDQCDVQCALIHTILCPIDAPTLTRVANFFSHKSISCLLPSWPMHVLILLSALPWNPHAMMSVQLRFVLSNNQMQG
jgi:hypothetical protein